MKTIIYLIVFNLVFIILGSGTLNTSERNKTVFLQSTDTKVSSQLLTQSAKIISDRLKFCGLDSPDISILADKGQIKVQIPDSLELSEIEGLLTSKGVLAFYETFNRKETADLLKNNNHLFELLKVDLKVSPTDPRIGCVTSEDQGLVEDYLRLNSLISNCKFLWRSKTYYESFTCLYALKINETGRSLLDRSDVETIKSAISKKDSQTYSIKIKFIPSSVKIWADATRNNLGKSIAIVLDDKVTDAPTVKSTMENGECEISGNLTQKEVNYFLALVNNDPLPLNFKLLK